MATATAKVCFKIDGEWYTNHVRGLVREGSWVRAMQNMRLSIVGIDYDTIVRILSGDAKFVGVNHLDLVDDDDQEFKQFLDWRYRATYREADRYWQPYAVVRAWDEEDASFASRKYKMIGEEKQKWYRRRSLFYADDIRDDRVWQTPQGEHVLWKRVAAPPFWIECVSWKREALTLRGGVDALELRGADGGERPVDIAPHFRAKEQSAFRYTGLKTDLLVATAGLLPNVSTEAIAGTLDRIFGDGADPAEIPEPAEVTEDHGWILRDGTFYSCLYHGHSELAGRLLRHIAGIPEDTVPTNTERAAEELGWLCVRSGAFRDGEVSIYAYGEKPTPEQRAAAFRWCKHRGLDVRHVLREFEA